MPWTALTPLSGEVPFTLPLPSLFHLSFLFLSTRRPVLVRDRKHTLFFDLIIADKSLRANLHCSPPPPKTSSHPKPFSSFQISACISFLLLLAPLLRVSFSLAPPLPPSPLLTLASRAFVIAGRIPTSENCLPHRDETAISDLLVSLLRRIFASPFSGPLIPHEVFSRSRRRIQLFKFWLCDVYTGAFIDST